MEAGSKLPMLKSSSDSLVNMFEKQGLPDGRSVALDDGSSFMTFNDAMNWTQVHPYSPTGSGQFLKLH